MAVVTKTERVALVATKTQLAAWKLAADEAGVTLSEWLRRSAQRELVLRFEGSPVREEQHLTATA